MTSRLLCLLLFAAPALAQQVTLPLPRLLTLQPMGGQAGTSVEVKVTGEHLEDIVSESILHESSHLNRFGAFITVVAAVAPLLGLLGTVTGMIQTFDVITEFGTSDPKLLSGGIAVALVTTELGLIVAIPLLLLGSLLNGWAERLKDDMEKGALKIINLAADVRGAAKAAG